MRDGHSRSADRLPAGLAQRLEERQNLGTLLHTFPTKIGRHGVTLIKLTSVH